MTYLPQHDDLQPKAMEGLILPTLALHNILMTSFVQGIYCPAGLTDIEDMNRELTQGHWRNNICVQSTLPLRSWAKGHKASIAAKKIRDIYADYFINGRAVDGKGENANRFRIT